MCACGIIEVDRINNLLLRFCGLLLWYILCWRLCITLYFGWQLLSVHNERTLISRPKLASEASLLCHTIPYPGRLRSDSTPFLWGKLVLHTTKTSHRARWKRPSSQPRSAHRRLSRCYAICYTKRLIVDDEKDTSGVKRSGEYTSGRFAGQRGPRIFFCCGEETREYSQPCQAFF